MFFWGRGVEVSVVALSHTHAHTHLNRFCVCMFLKTEDSKGALSYIWVNVVCTKKSAYRSRSYLTEKEQRGLVR